MQEKIQKLLISINQQQSLEQNDDEMLISLVEIHGQK
jgi:hypothetical protein